MKRRLLWVGSVVLSMAGILSGCSSGSGGTGGEGMFGSLGPTSGAGGSVTKPSCYLTKSGDFCECVAKNEDDSRPTSQWTKVSACNEATTDTPLTCTTDTKVDGTTTSCTCTSFRCALGSGGSCQCGASGSGDAVASCKSFEWYCARVDRTSCYGGNGTYGSACGNDEENVPSCSMSIIEREDGNIASCDGLKFVAPPPPAPSSGSTSSGCSGCSSDSDCHDKCQRCDRSTCSCVRRLSC